MSVILISGIVFAAVVGLVLAIWWAVTSSAALRARLAAQGPTVAGVDPSVLRTESEERFPTLAGLANAFPFSRGLDRLTDQAGWTGKTGEALALIILLGAVGALIGWARIGDWLGTIVCAAVGASIPVIYLRYLRGKRREKLGEQLPDALDMMVRALRAGYAFSAAIKLISEEMPDPARSEFARLFEEISLGRPPAEALRRFYHRLETEDVRFFYIAASIQRDVGGNLAEILEKLAEVIRERFKILSYARVLSAQHRMTAYCVAASPFAFALMFSILSPGFFDPLFHAPQVVFGMQIGKALILGALIWQVLGFLMLKRIATIIV